MKARIGLATGAFGALIGVVCVAVFLRCKAVPAMQEARAHSTVAAIAAAMATELSGSLAEEEFSDVGSEWRILDDAQYDRVISRLGRRYNLDPPKKGWIVGEALLDPWQNRFKVAVRKMGDNKYEVRVVSVGRDGELGTADDLVVE